MSEMESFRRTVLFFMRLSYLDNYNKQQKSTPPEHSRSWLQKFIHSLKIILECIYVPKKHQHIEFLLFSPLNIPSPANRITIFKKKIRWRTKKTNYNEEKTHDLSRKTCWKHWKHEQLTVVGLFHLASMCRLKFIWKVT